MENIIRLLQEKIGITRNQAEKIIGLFKGVLGDTGENVEDIRSKVTQKLEELESEAEDTANEASDTLNEYVDKIRNMFGSTDDNDSKTKKKQ